MEFQEVLCFQLFIYLFRSCVVIIINASRRVKLVIILFLYFEYQLLIEECMSID